MTKNDEINIEITGMSYDGSGVGRYEETVVFVPLTAPGDIIRAKILKVAKNCAYAKLVEIITPSPDRIAPDCGVSGKCGGCTYRHISYEAECRIKQQRVFDTMSRIGGIPLAPQPIISAENACFYRNKAQYPITENGDVGFFALHSHRIIPCGDCRLQPPEFAVITAEIKRWVNKLSVSIYDETSHIGLLRHIYLRSAAATGELMAVLVINGNEIPGEKALVSGLTGLFPDRIKSIQININKRDTNVVLGDKCRVIYGAPYITDNLCGLKIRISPLSFYQVNRDMAERLYKKAAIYADCKDKNILDLYCGAGTIGLSMAGAAKSVTGVEIIPQAVEDARCNAEINGISNARFICSDASQAVRQLESKNMRPDVVILDPPRKGCDAALLDTVANGFAPERIVYVSCDPATLARDVKLLSQYGYALTEYTPVDLFPRTPHVETVALMSRAKP